MWDVSLRRRLSYFLYLEPHWQTVGWIIRGLKISRHDIPWHYCQRYCKLQALNLRNLKPVISDFFWATRGQQKIAVTWPTVHLWHDTTIAFVLSCVSFYSAHTPLCLIMRVNVFLFNSSVAFNSILQKSQAISHFFIFCFRVSKVVLSNS